MALWVDGGYGAQTLSGESHSSALQNHALSPFEQVQIHDANGP